jgi:hypothetical protein
MNFTRLYFQLSLFLYKNNNFICLILYVFFSIKFSNCCIERDLVDSSSIPGYVFNGHELQDFFRMFETFQHNPLILTELSGALANVDLAKIPGPEFKTSHVAVTDILNEFLRELQSEKNFLITDSSVDATSGSSDSSRRMTTSSEIEVDPNIQGTPVDNVSQPFSVKPVARQSSPEKEVEGLFPFFTEFEKFYNENNQLHQLASHKALSVNQPVTISCTNFVETALKIIGQIEKQNPSSIIKMQAIAQYYHTREVYVEINGKKIDIRPYLIWMFQKYREMFYQTPSTQGSVLRSGIGFVTGTKQIDSDIPSVWKGPVNSIVRAILDKLDEKIKPNNK